LLEEEQLQGNEMSIQHLILCSGRIYFDLAGDTLRSESKHVTIVRMEQLYPFPRQPLEKLLDRLPALKRVVWVQEEPLNMGARGYLGPRLRQLVGNRFQLYYVGRPESSSPAEGSSTLYQINQQALIRQAFKVEEQTSSRSVFTEGG
jgi:2-oxoglutarate dehydrogenase E1 component